jgi:hypothetical protein
MEKNDILLLQDMRKHVLNLKKENAQLLRLASVLDLSLHNLGFKDNEWADHILQHVTTLDSAGTFTPQTDLQRQQAEDAVDVAVKAIIQLLDAKLQEAA